MKGLKSGNAEYLDSPKQVQDAIQKEILAFIKHESESNIDQIQAFCINFLMLSQRQSYEGAAIQHFS